MKRRLTVCAIECQPRKKKRADFHLSVFEIFFLWPSWSCKLVPHQTQKKTVEGFNPRVYIEKTQTKVKERRKAKALRGVVSR
jgi:hypothetical protein